MYKCNLVAINNAPATAATIQSMKQQICLIHGGSAFESYDDYLSALSAKEVAYERLLYSVSWRDWLADQLAGWDVVVPSMPNSQNAQYEEWKIYFSKVIPYLNPGSILVGHSLGGIFLAKFFNENTVTVPFSKIVLLAAPYDDESNESLGDFKLNSAAGLAGAAREIHIMHSTDDPIVLYAESAKYAADLLGARLHTFKDRHHFIGETFPELLEVVTGGV